MRKKTLVAGLLGGLLLAAAGLASWLTRPMPPTPVRALYDRIALLMSEDDVDRLLADLPREEAEGGSLVFVEWEGLRDGDRRHVRVERTVESCNDPALGQPLWCRLPCEADERRLPAGEASSATGRPGGWWPGCGPDWRAGTGYSWFSTRPGGSSSGSTAVVSGPGRSVRSEPSAFAFPTSRPSRTQCAGRPPSRRTGT